MWAASLLGAGSWVHWAHSQLWPLPVLLSGLCVVIVLRTSKRSSRRELKITESESQRSKGTLTCETPESWPDHVMPLGMCREKASGD
jgi:hypothetical protein